MYTYLLFVAGFIVLLASGHYIVISGVALARRLNLSTLVVGVVVVSFGTSAPEFFVSLRAALDGHSDLSVGNVIGSNISNIGLVLGLTSILFPLAVKSVSVKFDWPVMMFTGIVLFIFILNGAIGRGEGFVFLFLLLLFILYTVWKAREITRLVPVNVPPARFSLGISLLIIAGASLGLMIGAKMIVQSATTIASSWGISDRVISVSIIAVGTSLPELAASLVAALKKEPDISIGNIIGSNIYNTFGILGSSAAIKPLNHISERFESNDLFWMLSFYLVLFIFILPLKGGKLYRYKGLILLVGYIAYITFIFLN